MSEEDAVNLYNKYVDVINTLENSVKSNLNLALSKVQTAYEVLNRSWDSETKASKMKELEEIERRISEKIKLLNTMTIEISNVMSSLENNYGI